MPSHRAVYPSAYDEDPYARHSGPPPPQNPYHHRPAYPSPREYEDDGYEPRRAYPPVHHAPQYDHEYDRPQYDRQPRGPPPPRARQEAWTPPEGAKKGKKEKRDKVERYEEESKPSDDNTKNRKCHDVFWLILFIIAFGAMVAVGYYSIRYGNVNRLLYGRDSEGNLCGSINGTDSARDLRNETYLYYFDLDVNNTYKRCVYECPQHTADYNYIVCPYDISPATDVQGRMWQIGNGTCTVTIQSEAVLHRCIPTVLLADIRAAANATYYNQTYPMEASPNWGKTLSLDFNGRDVATMIFQDLAENWWVISVCVGAAFILSAAWLLLLQFFAGFIVWFTISLVLLAGWGLAGYFIYNYLRITVLHQGLLGTGFGQVDAALYNEKLLLTLGCVIGGIALILTLIILCMLRRIRLAVQIIKEASSSMKAMPMIVFFPFFKYLVLLIWMVVFIGVMALLATSGDVIAGAVEADINEGLSNIGKHYSSSGTLQYLQVYFVFGFLWVYNWIVAIGQCTVAGAIACWYWARDKKALPSLPVLKSFGRTLRYHLGSLAFGSLIIAIVQVIRLLIVEAQRRVKGTGNKAAQYLLCCLQCCFKCIEKVLKMLTKNAYVEIAVYGYSFCTAARMALEIIAANALRIIIVNKVSNFLIFIGKLAVVFITTLGGLGLMVYLEKDTEVFANYAVPLVFILIFSYITATAFLSTFSMAITTIFISFCEDSQRNDGSRERPYYMSKGLQKFVDKHAHDKPVV
ncbi:hypothetical protein SpCBS45565_g05392 [Spizellomyces sp. 'palustris']|nr:hypothetical protein SpCBS45565_g05392 [Spizellomyces sp. 'palustris']